MTTRERLLEIAYRLHEDRPCACEDAERAAALRALAARFDEEEARARTLSSESREPVGRWSHAQLALLARLDAPPP